MRSSITGTASHVFARNARQLDDLNPERLDRWNPGVMLWTGPATGIEMCQSAVAVAARLESAYGYKQTSSRPKSTSALPPKADVLVAVTDFRL